MTEKRERKEKPTTHLMSVNRVTNDHMQHSTQVKRQSDRPVNVSNCGGPSQENSPVEGEACDLKQSELDAFDERKVERGKHEPRTS